ncbi:MAG: hypothetical protein LPK18_13345 [Pseudomonadaceae bacterium]|nr:hypothetical protein [Pseudomonadaceae bacterium]
MFTIPRTPQDWLWLALDAAYLGGCLWLLVSGSGSHLVLAGLAIAVAALIGLQRLPAAGAGELWLIPLTLLLPFSVLSRYRQLRDRLASAPAEERPSTKVPATLPRRLAFSAVLLLALLGCLSGQLGQRVIDPVMAPLEEQATSTLQRSLALAAASYASARLIDRGIAFIAETQIGIGVIYVKPGQVFKPVQDMAVRYSDVMVLAMASVGIQMMLMEIGQAIGVTVLGALAIMALLLLQFAPRGLAPALALAARFFIAALVVIKLAIPLAAVAVGGISASVLEEQRMQAQARIDITTERLADAQQVTDENGFINWLKSVGGQAQDMFAGVKNLSEGLIERLVTLLVIYTLETLLLPLAMLFFIWRAAALYVLSGPRQSPAVP